MRIIRKYENRRLYDSTASHYVNLEDIAGMVRAGEDVRVVDAKTDADLTREVMLQIVLESHGLVDFLPAGLLRRVIRATGNDPAQRLLRHQLATALALLHDQLDRWEGAMGGWPRSPTPPAPSTTPPSSPPPPPVDELATLRERLASLEGRLRR